MNGFSQNLILYSRQILSGTKAVKHLNLSTLRKVFSLMGKKEKITLALLAAVALGSLLLSFVGFYQSHTTLAPTSGGSYTEGLKGQPLYINPVLAFQEPDTSLAKLVFSGLYKFNAKGELVADLAEGMPEVSQDQKQYTINLKRNVKWHNGRLLSADDVVFTINLIKDPAYKSPQRALWMATTVEKITDYQIKFSLKDVSGPFLYNLTLPILPQNIWSKIDASSFHLSENNLNAIGSGPYVIRAVEKQKNGKVKTISLEPFANYYADKPKIRELAMKFYDSEDDLANALRAGEIQGFGYTPLGSDQNLGTGQSGSNRMTFSIPQYEMAFFNLNNKTLADQNVRNALAKSIDRSRIISEFFGNMAILPQTPALKNQPEGGLVIKQPDYSLEEAKKLLEANGWTLESAGQTLTKKGYKNELTLATNDFSINVKTAQYLAEQWQSLGFKINLVILPTKQLTEDVVRTRNFDILLFPQKLNADPDPFLFWHSSQSKDPGLNLTGFNSPQADKLVTESRTTTDINIRNQKYQELYTLLEQKIPALFLAQTQYVYIIDKQIQGISLSTLYDPSQRFYNLPDWYITEGRVWK
jgi:peptide/nickel transport system substrate-binding protein